MRLKTDCLLTYFRGVLALAGLFAFSAVAGEDCSRIRQFTFSWPHADSCAMQPRGGTSRGAAVELDSKPSAAWKSLQDADLSPFQRDRRAILALAGGYRTSFDFLETVGYVPGFQPSQPYQSWGTELVLVAEDRGDFIRLQHIMVMFFQGEDGKVQGPMVMKHWRQDWQYQSRAFMVYRGNGIWSKEHLSEGEARGNWAQTVYQVDDSPRYGGYGRWQHLPNFSTWVSSETWRPLPRREHSVRDDYQVLAGTNRQSIVPNGWVHEQENYKIKLDENGELVRELPYLAKELGVNRYERVVNFDFSAGEKYWQATRSFWGDVAAFWDQQLTAHPRLRIRTTVAGMPMFQVLFDYAEKLQGGPGYDAESGRAFIAGTLAPYLEVLSTEPAPTRP